MSVCVGIDVHSKRSQVAVVTGGGRVRVNGNGVNGVVPILKVIGDLSTGTPVAFEAAYGWGWLVELPGGLRVRPASGASVAVQGDRLGEVEQRQGRRGHSGASCCARTCCRRRGSRRRRCGSCGRCCSTGSPWSGWALGCATGSTRWPPTTATTGPAASTPAPTGPARGDDGWPGCRCRRCPGGSSPTASGSSTRWRRPSTGSTGRSTPGEGRPAGAGVDRVARGGRVHRDGAAGRDRRHRPVR